MDLKREAEQLLRIINEYTKLHERQSQKFKAHIAKTGKPPQDCKSDKAFIQAVMQITNKTQKQVQHEFDYFDNEGVHITEDELKDKFIEHVATNKISREQIKPIAQVLDKISKTDYVRWYA